MIASQILLWIAVIALVALVARLARHVGIFQKRIVPAGVFTLHRKAIVGDVSTPMICQNTPKVCLKQNNPASLLFRNFLPTAKGIFDHGRCG